MTVGNDTKSRCEWCSSDPLYIEYHDTEWGVPVYDDQTLFEFLILEGAQAGLSWLTILKRRAGYQKAFAQFDAATVARYTPKKIDSLLQDPGIIRNRLKVEAAVINAQCVCDMRDAGLSLSDYLWRFVEGNPIMNHWKTLQQVPTSTPVSDRLAKDLKKRGFKFVGTTICYAFMQAVGLVNDHTQTCFLAPTGR